VPDGYRRIDLLEDPFVAVLPRDHELAGAGAVALTDLRGETWVSNDHPHSIGHRLLVAACSSAGLRPRFTVQAQDHHTAIAFVAAGVGVSVMPGLAAAQLPSSVVRLEVSPPTPVRHLAALVRDLGAPNPPAQRALELLSEIIAHPSGRRRRSVSPG
jgi:DNA-binding transcriptional LysR family regulator